MNKLMTILFFVQSVIGFSQTDTLNRIGADGKKYGYWIIYGKDRKNYGYSDTSIIETGKYEEGRKQGIWKTYHINGKLKSEIEYKNNRPNGKFTTYYDNGNKEEDGFWKGTYYVGKFTRYFGNGCKAQEKDFGTNGKSIWYVYYFPGDPCERKELEYNLDSSGYYTEFNIEGDTLRHQFGEPDRYWHSDYSDKQESNEKQIEIKRDTILKEQKVDKPNGYNKVYNLNNQIFQDGEFKNSKLYNGKVYIYDKYGLLDKIEIYKNGKYAGDAQID